MTRYLEPMKGGKWAISRPVEGRWVCLVQDSYVEEKGDAHAVLRALNMLPTKDNLDTYFPEKLFGERGYLRCPTLALMEMCNVLDPTIPIETKKQVTV